MGPSSRKRNSALVRSKQIEADYWGEDFDEVYDPTKSSR
jgi:hypothetical protein